MQRQINRLDGLVKYVAFHEPCLSVRIRPLWEKILRESGAQPSYPPRHQHLPPFRICIDEAEFQLSNGLVLALGLTTSQDPGALDQASCEILDQWLADLWTPGDRDKLLKNGLHFADAHPDLRAAYVKVLPSMPFEGFVGMARLTHSRVYEETYLRILGEMIRRRLMAAESQQANIVIEQNEKVSQERVREVIERAQARLIAENNRRPGAITVEFVAKPHFGISASDFLLGLLGRYLTSEDQRPGRPTPRDRVMFERVRDIYRLILDVDRGDEYSRRCPIMPEWANMPTSALGPEG